MAGSYELRNARGRARRRGIDIARWESARHGTAHGRSGKRRKDPSKLVEEDEVHNPGHGNPVAVSADGESSIEFVECLASCGTAPVAMVDDLFKEELKPGSRCSEIAEEPSIQMRLPPASGRRIRPKSESSLRISIAPGGRMTSRVISGTVAIQC